MVLRAMDTDTRGKALMRVRAIHTGDTVCFKVGPQPARLSRLGVFNSHAETMWDVLPTAVKPVPVIGAGMAFSQLPEEPATAVMHALREAVQCLPLPGAFPGHTPGTAMQALSDSIQVRQEAGELSDQTARTAIRALRELGRAMSDAGPPEEAVIRARQQSTQAQEECGKLQQSESRRVARVVYGEVPDGYSEVQAAKPLVRHEKYCVVVFGNEAFNVASDLFVR